MSSADLATNIGKASSALAVGGNTYEQTLAMLTSITEINRNGSRSARALVSVQSRLNQVLDETSSTGEKLTQWYGQHNIALYDQEGQLRSLFDIMKDVASQWNTLSDNEQRYFLLTQAGANQSANLGALLSNFNTAIEAETAALNSNGSAMKENAAYMDSIEARAQLVKADFQSLAVDVIDSKLVKSVLSLSSAFLQLADTGLGQVLTKMTLVGGIVGSGGALLKASKLVPVVTESVKNLGAVISGTASLTAGGLTLALGGIAALTVGIIELVRYIKDVNDPVKQLSENLEEIDKVQERISKHETISNLAKRYKELREQAELTKEEEAELDSVRRQLAEHTGGLVGENDAYNESLDKTVEKLAEMSGLEIDRYYGVLIGKLKEGSGDYQKAIRQQEEYNNKIREAENAFESMRQRFAENKSINDSAAAIENLSERLQKFLTMDDDMTSEARRQGIKEFAQEYYILTGNIDALVNKTEDFGENGAMLLDLIQQLSPDDVDYVTVFSKMSQDIQDLIDNAPSLEEVINSYKENVFEAMAAGYLDIKDAIKLLGSESAVQTGNIINDYLAWVDAANTATDAAKENGEEAKNSLDGVSERLQNLHAQIDATQEIIGVLTNAQDEYNASGSISIDTLQELLRLDGEYFNALFDENGQLNLNAESISNLISGKNVLLDRLAAEAVATYAVEEAERQLADQNGTLETTSGDVKDELTTLTSQALATGAAFMSSAAAVDAFYNVLSTGGYDLDESHFNAWMKNVQNRAAQVSNLLKNVNVGAGGWRSNKGGSSTTRERTKQDTTNSETEVQKVTNAHSELIARLEAEYALLEAQGASTDELVNKAQDIQKEYNKEVAELKKTKEYLNNDEEALKTVNKESENWYKWQDKIVKKLSETSSHYTAISGLLESELNLLEHQGASYDERIAKINQMQAEAHIEAERLRAILANAAEYDLSEDEIATIETNINELSSKWWDLQEEKNKINEERLQIQEKAYEDQLKAQTEAQQKFIDAQQAALEKHQQAIMALQDLMQDYYQGQIDGIDAQIQALQDANAEIEEQIDLQEKLDALAKAKQQKVLVYKDGRWQYVDDPAAVSAASKDLSEYKRQQKLQEEISGLEAEKQALENLRDAWGNLTAEYEQRQNEWLVSQELGINTALSGWENLVKGAEYWASQYVAIMNNISQLSVKSAEEQQSGGAGTAATKKRTATNSNAQYTRHPSEAGLSRGTYDQNIDYSLKMANAQDAYEWQYWASRREAKIVGEGMTPEQYRKTNQQLWEEWLAKHPTNNGLANGTMGAKGGLTLVGEKGAELRVLNRGDGIIPNNLTKNLMEWGKYNPSTYRINNFGGFGGKQMNVTIQAINLPNVSDGAGFVDYLKNALFGDVLSYAH